MRRAVIFLTLALTIGYALPCAMAQGQPARQGGVQAEDKPVCPLPPCTEVDPRGIDIADAKIFAAAAAAAAAKVGWNVGIAVVDVNGDLVYFERMDGAHHNAVTSAIGKARSGALFGLSGREVAAAISAGKPLTLTLPRPQAWPSEMAIQPGSLPLLKNGKVVAGVGIGGARPTDAERTAGVNFPDEVFAKAGIAAIASKGYQTR